VINTEDPIYICEGIKVKQIKKHQNSTYRENPQQLPTTLKFHKQSSWSDQINDLINRTDDKEGTFFSKWATDKDYYLCMLDADFLHEEMVPSYASFHTKCNRRWTTDIIEDSLFSVEDDGNPNFIEEIGNLPSTYQFHVSRSSTAKT
jgi:hypothetical protein